jgi:hypothetical protein
MLNELAAARRASKDLVLWRKDWKKREDRNIEKTGQSGEAHDANMIECPICGAINPQPRRRYSFGYAIDLRKRSFQGRTRLLDPIPPVEPIFHLLDQIKDPERRARPERFYARRPSRSPLAAECTVDTVAFPPDGQLLTSAGQCEIILWDLHSGTWPRVLELGGLTVEDQP